MKQAVVSRGRERSGHSGQKTKQKKQPACILVITHIQIKGNIFTQTGSYLHIYIQQTETFTETLIHHGATPNIGFYYIYIFLYIS